MTYSVKSLNSKSSCFEFSILPLIICYSLLFFIFFIVLISKSFKLNFFLGENFFLLAALIAAISVWVLYENFDSLLLCKEWPAFSQWILELIRKIKAFISFIISEISFFVSLFWTALYYRFGPSIHTGSTWAPRFLRLLSVMSLPNVNTSVLTGSSPLLSAIERVTKIVRWIWSLFCILIPLLSGFLKQPAILRMPLSISIDRLYGFQFDVFRFNLFILLKFIFTLSTSLKSSLSAGWVSFFILAFSFLSLQLYEYSQASFFLGDGTWSSIFFLITSFHGAHVFIGGISLILVFLFCRYTLNQPVLQSTSFTVSTAFLTITTSLGEVYWHFVDAVWLFVLGISYLSITESISELLVWSPISNVSGQGEVNSEGKEAENEDLSNKDLALAITAGFAIAAVLIVIYESFFK